MARPHLELDEKLIENLASVMCSHEEIAMILGCSSDTLVRRYLPLIDRGRAKAKVNIRKRQFDVAMKGNVGMLIWLGKQLLGQSDKHVAALFTNPNTAPQQAEKEIVLCEVREILAIMDERELLTSSTH